MRCVLHIGTEKTATTTLQQHLDRHRSALAAEGVGFTRSAGVGNNWRLAVAAYDDDRHDDRSADAGVGDAASRQGFRARLVADLKAEIATLRAEHGAETVLFSSEHLHSRLTSVSEVERLAELLDAIGVTHTTVVVYLREPVSLAASLHSTLVKHGLTRRVPPPPEPGTYYHLLCDHRGSIERWETVFDVTPRLFEPDALTGGSIVSDLAHTLGAVVPMSGPELDDPHLNRSLSTAEIEVLARINERLGAAVDGRPNERHTALVTALERHSSGPGYRLPPRLAELYREAFVESNEWVRARFFPEREYLFAAEHPDHDPGPWSPGYDGLASFLLEVLGQAD